MMELVRPAVFVASNLTLGRYWYSLTWVYGRSSPMEGIMISFHCLMMKLNATVQMVVLVLTLAVCYITTSKRVLLALTAQLVLISALIAPHLVGRNIFLCPQLNLGYQAV